MTVTRPAGYIRVSSAMQAEDGWSLAAQERAIRAYCAAHGWPEPVLYADEGISAHTDDVSKRAAFAAMLADAETGRFDVLIVHKLDRFARNVITALDTLQRLERAGIGFVSISESMDFASPIGRVLLTLLAAFAQYYSDNLSAETKKGKAERKRQGLYNGVLPFGVTTAAGGVPTLDTRPWACNIASREELVPGVGLRDAYRMAASGLSDREIARALNERGFRTSGNRGQNRFQKDSVRVILTNRFYLGELPDGDGGWLPGRHEEMIAPALFALAGQQRARYGGRVPRKVTTHQTWALAGIAWCGRCGAPMRMHGRRRVCCAGRVEGLGCPERSVSADAIEDQLGAVLAKLRPTASALALLADAPPEPAAPDGLSRPALERKLARLRDLYLDGDLDRTEYAARRRAVETELALLPEERPTPAPGMDDALAGWLCRLGEGWAAMTAAERNATACQLFSRVYIMDQAAVLAVPKPELRGLLRILIPTPRKRRASVLRCGYPIPAGALWLDGPRPVIMPHRGHRHALTPAQETEIRRRGDTTRALALEYGVSRQTITNIRRRGGVR